MSVKSCEKIEKSQVVLTIEVGAPEFEAAIEKAYQKMRKKINVPGFRPGKAPRKIIEGMYGAEVFFEEAINIAFPEAYEAAVKEQELQVVGYPSVEIEGQVTRDGFTFKATAPVYPEVTLGQYKGLSAPKEEVKVSAADVDERLKALTDRNTRLVSVDREAKEGDTVVIDFEGFLEGKPFEGGKGENFSLELGSHTFVPGFEEQLVGVKAGDEKDLDITFPEDYHKDLAGKAVVFKVKVHQLLVVQHGGVQVADLLPLLAVENVGLGHVGIACLAENVLHAVLNVFHGDLAVMDLILVIRRDPQGQEINDVRIVLHVGGLKGLGDGGADLGDVERGDLSIPLDDLIHETPAFSMINSIPCS